VVGECVVIEGVGDVDILWAQEGVGGGGSSTSGSEDRGENSTTTRGGVELGKDGGEVIGVGDLKERERGGGGDVS